MHPHLVAMPLVPLRTYVSLPLKRVRVVLKRETWALSLIMVCPSVELLTIPGLLPQFSHNDMMFQPLESCTCLNL
jgi:hypothetical protein